MNYYKINSKQSYYETLKNIKENLPFENEKIFPNEMIVYGIENGLRAIFEPNEIINRDLGYALGSLNLTPIRNSYTVVDIIGGYR